MTLFYEYDLKNYRRNYTVVLNISSILLEKFQKLIIMDVGFL